jgi:hypothetical protein
MGWGFKSSHQTFNFLHGSSIEIVIMSSSPRGFKAIDMLDNGLLIQECSCKCNWKHKSEYNSFHRVGYYIKIKKKLVLLNNINISKSLIKFSSITIIDYIFILSSFFNGIYLLIIKPSIKIDRLFQTNNKYINK